MTLHIVPATPADMDSIRQVQKLSWLETYPDESLGISRDDISQRFAADNTPAGKQQMVERIKRFFQPNAYTWVAKDNNTIVGYCLAIKGTNSNRIQAIYLLADYQGQGIGKQFILKALDWLGKNQPIYLNVASYNTKAINFYQHMGFVKTGHILEEDFIALPSGQIIQEIEMVYKGP